MSFNDLCHERNPVDAKSVYPIENINVLTVVQECLDGLEAAMPCLKAHLRGVEFAELFRQDFRRSVSNL